VKQEPLKQMKTFSRAGVVRAKTTPGREHSSQHGLSDGEGRETSPGRRSQGQAKSGNAGHPNSGNGSANKAPNYEIIVFTKPDGPLTKRISLLNGSVFSDGSACIMSRGTARRVHINNVAHLGTQISSLNSKQAIALGTLPADLPDEVEITTKAKLLNGVARPNVIARTADTIIYCKEKPAFALIDTDSKGMPAVVKGKIKELGGYWPALLSVLPELRNVARVTRPSTSSGLSRSDTGAPLPGSDNLHIYIAVKDGTDIDRFLRAFHVRCWLAGLGWMTVSKSGALLERSLVDRMVGGAERLVFEGAPILVKPIQQDQHRRRPRSIEGSVLDTVMVCPPLTIREKAKLDKLKAKDAQGLEPEVAKVRAAYVEDKARELVARKQGMTMPAARRIIERQCDHGVLLPDLALPFDEKEFAGCTVGDVLADPDRFVGATLADPNEGIEYGSCKAKILRRPDGTLVIRSFAHGGTDYHLKLDAAAVRAAIEQANDDATAKIFVESAVTAVLDAHELEELRDLASKRSRVSKRTIDKMLKEAKQECADKQARQKRKRRAAARNDPRPQIPCPHESSPYLEQMKVLNDVLGSAQSSRPPSRDIDNDIMRVKKIRIPNTHAFTETSANAEPEEEG
jgi:hypothetical protein